MSKNGQHLKPNREQMELRHLVNLQFHQLYCHLLIRQNWCVIWSTCHFTNCFVNYSSGKTAASFGQRAISPTVLSLTHQTKLLCHLVNLPFHQLYCQLLIRQNRCVIWSTCHFTNCFVSTTHQAKPMRHLVNLPFHQLFCQLLIRQNRCVIWSTCHFTNCFVTYSSGKTDLTFS